MFNLEVKTKGKGKHLEKRLVKSVLNAEASDSNTVY